MLGARLKKVLSVFLSITLVASLNPVSAFAEAGDPDENASADSSASSKVEALETDASGDNAVESADQTTAESGSTEEPATIEGQISVPLSIDTSMLPSNEEMFEGYVDEAFLGDTKLNAYRVPNGDRLSGPNRAIYDALEQRIESVANGGLRYTVFEIEGTVLEGAQVMTAQELGVWPVMSNGYISQQEQQGMQYLLSQAFDFNITLTCLLSDNPYQLYWFNKTGNTGMSFNYEANADQAVITELIFYFPVERDYADSTYVTNASKCSAATRAADNAKRIVYNYRGYSDFDKLESYKTEICNLVTYDTAAESGNIPYGNPWQLVYVFDGDPNTNVVCEGYSKAFQYLCDLSEFRDPQTACYTMAGELGCYDEEGGQVQIMGGGAHMWNIVSLRGNQYLADVTNSDTGSVGEAGQLFLGGVNTGYNQNGLTVWSVDIPAGYVMQTVTYTLNQSEWVSVYARTSVLDLSAYPFTPSQTQLYVARELQQSIGMVYADQPPYLAFEVGTQPGGYEDAITYTWVFVQNGQQTVLSDFTGNTCQVPWNLNAGSYGIFCVAQLDDSTVESTMCNVSVWKRPITNAWLSRWSYTFDGRTHTPHAYAKADWINLRQGYDYDVFYQNGRRYVGAYRVAVIGRGNFTGVRNLYVYVNKTAFTAAWLSYWKCTYDGRTHTPVVTVKWGSYKMRRNVDYTLVYQGGRRNAGWYRICIHGIGNFKGYKTLYLKIDRARLTSAWLWRNTYWYNGRGHYPGVTAKSGRQYLVRNRDFTVAYDRYNRWRGWHWVYVKGIGNYAGAKRLWFHVI